MAGIGLISFLLFMVTTRHEFHGAYDFIIKGEQKGTVGILILLEITRLIRFAYSFII